jgi:putative sigma-54 modulation protein
MRVEVTGRHVNITPPLRQLIARRLTKLERLLNDSAISAQIVLSKEKYGLRAEIVVHVRGDHMLRGQGDGNSWPVAVRDAIAKIEQQAQTLKGKWGDRRRRAAGARTVVTAPTGPEPSRAPRIVRATRYAVKPMSVDDVALRMESGAETFVVFRNADNDDAVNILYRRTDGNYGLIEPD